MAGHDIIVIGASAGGVTALQKLFEDLPPKLGAALFVVLHLSPGAKSALPRVLGRSSALPVAEAKDGEPIRSGRVYVAVPDRHLMLRRDGCIHLSRGPKENHTRPAVDPLFRSAALSFGPRVIGVVLTGYLDDGTSGLVAIKARGGISVVQDPEDARYDGMPRSALKGDSPDHCVPLAGMADLFCRLVAQPAAAESSIPVPDWLQLEVRIAESEPPQSTEGHVHQLGRPSPFVCPECSGTLFEIEETKEVRYRCRVGHAYSPKTFEASHREELEAALWTAARALEESASLARRMADRARATKRARAAVLYDGLAEERSRQAEQMRSLILTGTLLPVDAEAV